MIQRVSGNVGRASPTPARKRTGVKRWRTELRRLADEFGPIVYIGGTGYAGQRKGLVFTQGLNSPIAEEMQCMTLAKDCAVRTVRIQSRSLRQREDLFRRIDCEKLRKALFPAFAVMADRFTADEMRIDLERNEPERAQRRWLDDRHVVSGTDRRARYVAARAPSYVRRTGQNLRANRIDNTGVIHPLEKRKSVAASDCDSVRLLYRRERVLASMNRFERIPKAIEYGFDQIFVTIETESDGREWHEQHLAWLVFQQRVNLLACMFEITELILA